jgi:hypothetical protein
MKKAQLGLRGHDSWLKSDRPETRKALPGGCAMKVSGIYFFVFLSTIPEYQIGGGKADIFGNLYLPCGQ